LINFNDLFIIPVITNAGYDRIKIFFFPVGKMNGPPFNVTDVIMDANVPLADMF
jgi:hypothetical protein